MPSQTRAILPRYGISRAQADREVWAVEPGGTLYAGAAAVNRALAELGLPWRALAAAYRLLPPLRWIEVAAYRWVAANRHRLARYWGSTPECEQPGVDCE